MDWLLIFGVICFFAGEVWVWTKPDREARKLRRMLESLLGKNY